MAARKLVRALAWFTAAVLTYLWLNLVLELIPHTRPLGDRLTHMLLDVLASIGESVLRSIPGLAFVAVIFVIARFAAATGRAFFDRVKRQNLTLGWLDRDTAPPTAAIFSVGVWLFALAMAYPYLPGAQSQAFQGVSVLVGLMVSIGASGTVSQAASGLMLMYTRAYRVGEFVRIHDTEGTVVDVGLLSTRIRTGLGEEVMLPNTLVLGNTSKNYSRAVPGTGFVVHATVTIGYDTPWRQVHRDADRGRGERDLTPIPQPRVVQTALSDSTSSTGWWRIEAAGAAATRRGNQPLHANIQDVFNEHGVQIMSPHYVADPAEAKVVPPGRWFAAPAVDPGAPPAEAQPAPLSAWAISFHTVGLNTRPRCAASMSMWRTSGLWWSRVAAWPTTASVGLAMAVMRARMGVDSRFGHAALDPVQVHAAAAEERRGARVLRAALHRRAQRDHFFHQSGQVARHFARHHAAQAPADQRQRAAAELAVALARARHHAVAQHRHRGFVAVEARSARRPSRATGRPACAGCRCRRGSGPGPSPRRGGRACAGSGAAARWRGRRRRSRASR